jgi:hypothetical protein
VAPVVLMEASASCTDFVSDSVCAHSWMGAADMPSPLYHCNLIWTLVSFYKAFKVGFPALHKPLWDTYPSLANSFYASISHSEMWLLMTLHAKGVSNNTCRKKNHSPLTGADLCTTAPTQWPDVMVPSTNAYRVTALMGAAHSPLILVSLMAFTEIRLVHSCPCLSLFLGQSRALAQAFLYPNATYSHGIVLPLFHPAFIIWISALGLSFFTDPVLSAYYHLVGYFLSKNNTERFSK